MIDHGHQRNIIHGYFHQPRVPSGPIDAPLRSGCTKKPEVMGCEGDLMDGIFFGHEGNAFVDATSDAEAEAQNKSSSAEPQATDPKVGIYIGSSKINKVNK